MMGSGLLYALATTRVFYRIGLDFQKAKILVNRHLSQIVPVGIVAIGRNEGKRFQQCLSALPKDLPTVYVDSGSTDDSVAHALAAGVQVVHLSRDLGFTAARARNMGWRALREKHPDLKFIQFLDGDCALDPNWLSSAFAETESKMRLGAVFGRLKERFPEHSIYNAMCDREWDVPVGEVRTCGGNALIRVDALLQTGGYNDGLIAGEEPDLCLRMRAMGWAIYRIPPKMATHDAAILNFGSWWKRSRRAGHAYAEHVAVHGRFSDPDWRRDVVRMTVWGILLPVIFTLGAILGLLSNPLWGSISLGVGLLYALQIGRISHREAASGLSDKVAFQESVLLMLAKFAQVAGATSFLLNRLFGRRPAIIEYKS